MDADAAGEVWAEARSSQMLGAGLRNVKWGGGQQRNATNRYNIHTPLSQPDTGHTNPALLIWITQTPTSDFPVISDDGGSWCAIIIIREQITTGHHQPNQVVWLHGQQFTTSIKCNLCNLPLRLKQGKYFVRIWWMTKLPSKSAVSGFVMIAVAHALHPVLKEGEGWTLTRDDQHSPGTKWPWPMMGRGHLPRVTPGSSKLVWWVVN